MPRRSKKSKAAGEREQAKTNEIKPENDKPSTSHFDNELSRNNENWKVMSGKLHQGDNCFQYPGIQCTYISFWALVYMTIKTPMSWNVNDIDSCVINGNARFLEHCIQRKLQPQKLLAKELPKFVVVNSNAFECHQLDEEIKVGTLNQESIDDKVYADTLSNALFKSLLNSDSCLFVCGGQTIAIAKRENTFYVFDPHSRGNDGLLHHTGSAVLVSFTEIECLTMFIEKLFLRSLRLKSSEMFELVPIQISMISDDKERQILKQTCSATRYNHSKYSIEVPMERIKEVQSSAQNIQKDSFDDEMKTSSALHVQAIDSYFADQSKRNEAHKEKIALERSPHQDSNVKRKDYMRQYMQKRRVNESCRKQDNNVARMGMKKNRETDQGKVQNAERTAQGMKRLPIEQKKKKKTEKRLLRE